MPRRCGCRFAPKGRLSRHSGLRGKAAPNTAVSQAQLPRLPSAPSEPGLGRGVYCGDMGAALWENIGLQRRCGPGVRRSLQRRYGHRFVGLRLGTALWAPLCGKILACHGDMGVLRENIVLLICTTTAIWAPLCGHGVGAWGAKRGGARQSLAMALRAPLCGHGARARDAKWAFWL